MKFTFGNSVLSTRRGVVRMGVANAKMGVVWIVVGVTTSPPHVLAGGHLWWAITRAQWSTSVRGLWRPTETPSGRNTCCCCRTARSGNSQETSGPSQETVSKPEGFVSKFSVNCKVLVTVLFSF